MGDFHTTTPSPLGKIVLTSNGYALTGLYTPEHCRYAQVQQGECDPAPFSDAIRQLDEYFAGHRKEFSLALAPQGTVFQRYVWNALCGILYGEVGSYSDIATAIGKPGAARAVGSANSRNPICIIIPCHRIISRSGALAGYAGGLCTKEWLIKHEGK